jgi:hypothetical protein
MSQEYIVAELRRLHDKMDKLDSRVDILVSDCAVNTNNLKEHMRRSKAAEESVTLLRAYIDTVKNESEKHLEPVEKFVDRAKFFFLVCSVVGTIITLLATVGLLQFKSLF